MPEGPSIVILREEVAAFTGQRIERAEGSAKVDKARLTGQVVREFRSWGKHLLIELEDVSVRIHLLLFGSYRINERKDSTPRLSLGFADGELNFYACSVQLIEGPLDAAYDWSMDVMSAAWSPRGTLNACASTRVCWPAMRCWTRRCSPAPAISSRTRCSIASACTRCR